MDDEPRFWVNWASEAQLHPNKHTDETQLVFAVVDEVRGGEIAYFLDNSDAEDYCTYMNYIDQE